ncbi:MAG: acyl carrier protein [Lachnospiraceae bacterium]|nr:acyl carrier protein [Lachnospiraceae bacterium]MBP5413736.1 acyl carrier protein [Lachnospiraceae bacterium]MBP5745068.1 acyl carrier protein [Lachnospiraceae bacterium]
MEDKIKEIVISVLELAEDDAKQIEEDTDLLEYGLDSMTCVGVVVSLEEEFGITVDEEDLLVENMSTISKIKELVEKYED